MDQHMAKRIQELEFIVKKQDEEIKSLQLTNQMTAANLGLTEGPGENAVSQSQSNYGSAMQPRQTNFDYQVRHDTIRPCPTVISNGGQQVVDDVDRDNGTGKHSGHSSWIPKLPNLFSGESSRKKEEKKREEIRRKTEEEIEQLRLENERELEKLRREAAEKQLRAEQEARRRQIQMDENMRVKREEARAAEKRRQEEIERQEKLNEDEMKRHQMDVERKKEDLLKHKQRLREEEEREKARIDEEKKRRMERLNMILNHENKISNLNDWCGQPD